MERHDLPGASATDSPSQSTSSKSSHLGDPCLHASTITKLFQKAFVSGGVAFRFIENKYFVEALGLCCPQYQVPKRKAFVRDIDALHGEIGGLKCNTIKGKHGTVASDGATLHDGRSFRNYFFVTEPEARAIHLASVDLAERSKDAQTLLDELEKWVEEVRTMGGIPHGCTTDNASNELLSTHNLELRQDGSWLPSAGCKEHAIELLLEDILGTSKRPAPADLAKLVEPIDQAIEISQYFLLRPRLKALHFRALRESPAFEHLPTHAKSRFYLHHKAKVFASKVLLAIRVFELQDITRYLCRHRLFMERVAAGDRARAREISVLVNESGGAYYQRLEGALLVLRPILACLRKQDCTSALLCRFKEAWVGMERDSLAAMTSFDHVNANVLARMFEGRRKEHIGDIEEAAHLLQPDVLKTKTLDTFTAQEQALLERVLTKAGLRPQEGIAEYAAIVAKNGPYTSTTPDGEATLMWNSVSKMRPLSWYQLHIKEEVSPNILILATPLVCLKASQGVSERGWGLMDWISGSRRKRLTPDRLLRLVDIAWWLNKSQAHSSSFLEMATTDDEELSEVGEEEQADHDLLVDCLGEASGHAPLAQTAEAHASAAVPFLEVLRRARQHIFVADGAQLLSATMVSPWLEELCTSIVTRETLLQSKVVPAVVGYCKHGSVEIRIAAKRIKQAWADIYGHRTTARSVEEFHAMDIPPAAAPAPAPAPGAADRFE